VAVRPAVALMVAQYSEPSAGFAIVRLENPAQGLRKRGDRPYLMNL